MLDEGVGSAALGAVAGLLGLKALSGFMERWYKEKASLLKDFDEDDFERMYEDGFRPVLKKFIEDAIMEKLTEKMPPEWWVSFSRRHAIKRRVAETAGEKSLSRARSTSWCLHRK